jgi:hypothetical protein
LPSTDPPNLRFWPGIRLDLVGATLIDFNLKNGVMADANFSRATFSGPASFRGATVSGYASFRGATFSGYADFSWATVSGDAWFNGATFSGDVWFRGATFSGGRDEYYFDRSRVTSPDAEHVWPMGWRLGPDGSGGYTVVRANDAGQS